MSLCGLYYVWWTRWSEVVFSPVRDTSKRDVKVVVTTQARLNTRLPQTHWQVRLWLDGREGSRDTGEVILAGGRELQVRYIL